jgi:uncharacterized protein YdiU (UPF0061 family)
MQLNLQDTFNKELPADPITENSRRQVLEAAFSYVTPRVPSAPSLVHVSEEMLLAIGLEESDKDTDDFLNFFSGADAGAVEGIKSYAMCYGGHQFGGWAGQLGDGRAINLGEVVHNNQRWALQLKGAGATPYSRRGDGLAVLRSSVREHLCSEAMHHLGVPSTRSLSLSLTGDDVLRDMLYNGNTAYEKGAVVCRVAPSFVRFGNFQIFAARQDVKNLRKLTDYTIRHFYPGIEVGTKAGYIKFFCAVAERTLEMVLHWQRVGFVHGVMNTDNMSILGLTIDYGPYGWLEGYDKGWTPNTTDAQGRRYRFGYQEVISLWNLAQLGNTLILLTEDTKPLEDVLEWFKATYTVKYAAMMRNKLGLQTMDAGDGKLVRRLEELLQASETDMTIFFRQLARFKRNTTATGKALLTPVMGAFYAPTALEGELLNDWATWFDDYRKRLQKENTPDAERRSLMDAVNPKYVLRNYMAQLAIDKADAGDYALIDELHQLLKRPYDEQPEHEHWFAKRPEWARHKVGCSMLSCSS